MSKITTRLRWRIARWIAPASIIASPGDEEGVYILQQSGPGPYRWRMWIKAATFVMSLTSALRPLTYTSTTYEPPLAPRGTFSGTVGPPA